MLSYAELSCELPENLPIITDYNETSTGKPTCGYYIQLSNDGKNYSKNKTLLVIYDSKCMTCTNSQENASCRLKV